MRKTMVGIIALTIITLIVGCESGKESLSPEQVIEKYFKALKEKDVNKLMETMTKDRFDEESINNWLSNIEKITLISIDGENVTVDENSYRYHGRGRTLNPAAEKILWVEYEALYDEIAGVDEYSGKHSKNYILIKITDKSPWLIDDWGY